LENKVPNGGANNTVSLNFWFEAVSTWAFQLAHMEGYFWQVSFTFMSYKGGVFLSISVLSPETKNFATLLSDWTTLV